jgi:DNA anti-recombination protein RmuC
MKDLSSRVKKTQQALYQLIKQNESLSSIVKENTEKNGRFIKYGEPVLSWLLDYYKITEPTANEVGEGIVEPAVQAIPQTTAPTRPTETDLAIELSSIRAENEALKNTIEALKNDLEREREEKKELREQLGISLLALRQEQEEKQLYLPAPRKTLSQFFKDIFSK